LYDMSESLAVQPPNDRHVSFVSVVVDHNQTD
jgi:hypothetical protein